MLVRQRYDLDRTVRLVINCVLFIALIWLINILKDVLLPFCVGCLIAYLFEPFVQFNRNLLKLKGRILATFITLSEMTFIFLLICYFIIPMIMNEASQMASMLKAYASPELHKPFVHSHHKLDITHNGAVQLGDCISVCDLRDD